MLQGQSWGCIYSIGPQHQLLPRYAPTGCLGGARNLDCQYNKMVDYEEDQVEDEPTEIFQMFMQYQGKQPYDLRQPWWWYPRSQNKNLKIGGHSTSTPAAYLPGQWVVGRQHATSLLWRHNDHGGVSNHQPHGCLLTRLFRRRSKKLSKLRVTGICAGNSPGPVNSPHKGPVTRKMVPFDDVIMYGGK